MTAGTELFLAGLWWQMRPIRSLFRKRLQVKSTVDERQDADHCASRSRRFLYLGKDSEAGAVLGARLLPDQQPFWFSVVIAFSVWASHISEYEPSHSSQHAVADQKCFTTAPPEDLISKPPRAGGAGFETWASRSLMAFRRSAAICSSCTRLHRIPRSGKPTTTNTTKPIPIRNPLLIMRSYTPKLALNLGFLCSRSYGRRSGQMIAAPSNGATCTSPPRRGEPW
ncbi:MAG: hypothetical protein JWP01_2529 [Myxococcales bacterium]|nr:hypothetical protein [Myxococcales bacterium]